MQLHQNFKEKDFTMNKVHEFCQMIGLHPLVGFGMFAIDWMLFAGEGSTLGTSWLISIGVAIALTLPSVLVQRYGFKDEWGLAIGKGLMVGCITAIPTSLPSIVPLVGGALGTVTLLSNNRSKVVEK
jgi:hypothetical protein